MNKTNICKSKGLSNIFHTNFVLEVYLKIVQLIELKKLILNGNIYNSSNHYGLIDVKNVVLIHKYLMRKRDIK